ncbi:unnamed protein product [Caenorhabditis angaria]|uniref:Uncharacterized protein n=1 Tax=Caenorhabditis angaria TaxID=860376 RepID=A0A9P1N4C0_9PELO|nr:unnamed protein product [Caenorhabditis angaria]
MNQLYTLIYMLIIYSSILSNCFLKKPPKKIRRIDAPTNHRVLKQNREEQKTRPEVQKSKSKSRSKSKSKSKSSENTPKEITANGKPITSVEVKRKSQEKTKSLEKNRKTVGKTISEGKKQHPNRRGYDRSLIAIQEVALDNIFNGDDEEVKKVNEKPVKMEKTSAEVVRTQTQTRDEPGE